MHKSGKQALLYLLIMALCACSATKGKKTNVLTNDAPTASTGRGHQENSRYRPFQTLHPDMDASKLEYRSREYFLYKADSLQLNSARAAYYKNLDTIIAQLSAAPHNTSNPAVNTDQWYAAIDFNIRRPNFVILHHTAQDNVEQTLFTFSLPRPGRESSAHYVIGKDGKVFHMLNDYVRSWHAGVSKWGGVTDINSCSLGIEIDNNGRDEPFTDAQVNSLLLLLDFLKTQYKIPQANFIAHSDIAPGRKEDPGILFPWEKLAKAGFGFWYDSSTLKNPPGDFNATWALRVIGYDIKDPSKAIQAFKIHYLKKAHSDNLTDYDKKVLYNIALKYL